MEKIFSFFGFKYDNIMSPLYIYFLCLIMLCIIVVSMLSLSKKGIIGFRTARWIAVISFLLTAIPASFAVAGILFAFGMTIFLSFWLYWLFWLHEIIEKRKNGQPTNIVPKYEEPKNYL